jgi:hypothetical protein
MQIWQMIIRIRLTYFAQVARRPPLMSAACAADSKDLPAGRAEGTRQDSEKDQH